MPRRKNKITILVTGGTGKIGKSLVVRLAGLGYGVRVLSRRAVSSGTEGIEYYRGEITDVGVVRRAMTGCGAVYHLAAKQGSDNKEESERVNVEGTRTVLNLVKQLGVRMLVYCSTVMVFEDTGGCMRDELWRIRESITDNAYINTKVKALMMVRNYRGSVPTVVVYPSIVIDKGDFGGWKGFPGAIMSLVGKTDRMMNVVWLEDVVDGLVKIINYGVSDDFIFGGQNIEVGKYRRLMCQKLHRRDWYFRIPNFCLALVGIRPPEDIFFSSDKAKKILGYKTKRVV